MVREKIKIEGTPVIGEEPVTKLFEKIMNKSKIFIVNDQLGAPTHVDFVSDITLKILEKIIINPNINSNIFHISPKDINSRI